MKKDVITKGAALMQEIAKVHEAKTKAQNLVISYAANGTTYTFWASNISNGKRYVEKVDAAVKRAKEIAEIVLEKELNEYLAEIEKELSDLKDE